MREISSKYGDKLKIGTFYCIGKNYSEHAKEMGGEVPTDPIVFLKPPNAFAKSGSMIKLPDFSDNVHFETELVVVIGKDCDGIAPENAGQIIEGFAIGWDLTLRDIQARAKEKGHPWTVAKAFKNSAPVSEYLPFKEFNDPDFEFELTCRVNGEIRQRDMTSKMERPVSTLISYLADVFGLRRGDMIFTGTPKGVGQVVTGDKLSAELSGLLNIEIELI